MSFIKYFIIGLLFGFILIKAEVVSWFRIQEMFRFQSFHMYGIIGSAIAVGAVSIYLIKKFKLKSADGNPIVIIPKELNKGTVIGGIIFGFGWALTGACPGPLYALTGSGASAYAMMLVFALIGTYTYGVLKDKLPH